MPRIQAFRALHYTPAAGRPDDLVAPPYDVLDDAGRARLAARSPHNLVHLTLPEAADPARPETRYADASERLAAWLAEGVLVRDAEPALFAMTQAFTLPDGTASVRAGVLAAMRLHDFDEGVVLPHERILTAPFEDRLRLRRATRTQLEPIFLVLSDPTGTAREAVAEARRDAPVMTATTGDGVVHGLHRIAGRARVDAVAAALEAQRAVIADGHHRYQTALAYRDEVGRDREGPHQWVLAFLCPLEDPGLVILPTHRLVHSVADLSVDRLLEAARPRFEVTRLEADPAAAPGRAAILDRLADAGRDGSALAMIDPEGGAWLWRRRADAVPEALAALPQDLAALDVSVLHGGILQDLLGLSPESQARKENLRYVDAAGPAFDAIAHGAGQLLFLMNATPMAQVRAVAEAGHRMPQKSTFFFPKLASGLAMNPLGD